MRNISRGLACLVAALSVGTLGGAALATPAQAADGKSITDLKKDGYSCERAGVNFTSCEKDKGGKTSTYFCDDTGACQYVSGPARTKPKPKLDRATPGDGAAPPK